MIPHQEIKSDIERHTKAAYEMLPEHLTPFVSYVKREDLDSKFNQGEWRSVCRIIQDYSRTNNFSLTLLQELSAAQKGIDLLDYDFLVQTLEQLSGKEKKLMGECLRAIAYGPFVSDNDFRPLMGLTREELVAIADEWPNIDQVRNLVIHAITGSLSNLLNYQHRHEAELQKYTSATWQQVRALAEKWHDLRKQRGK